MKMHLFEFQNHLNRKHKNQDFRSVKCNLLKTVPHEIVYSPSNFGDIEERDGSDRRSVGCASDHEDESEMSLDNDADSEMAENGDGEMSAETYSQLRYL